MHHISPLQHILLFLAAIIAGIMNSLAGGGTLVTFPALLAMGFPARIANATNTLALWPGVISSLWGYRKYVSDKPRILLYLGTFGVLGGASGAIILSHTSDAVFGHVVPWLILGTTVLFATQSILIQRARQGHVASDDPMKDNPPFTRFSFVGMALMFVFAFYGGYFGAGLGILILTLLGYMGFTHIHRMNGIKNTLAGIVNLMAILIFASARLPVGQGAGAGRNLMIDWVTGLLMALGSITGGLVGSHYAKRVGQKNVRRIIIFIGAVISISLILHPPK